LERPTSIIDFVTQVSCSLTCVKEKEQASEREREREIARARARERARKRGGGQGGRGESVHRHTCVYIAFIFPDSTDAAKQTLCLQSTLTEHAAKIICGGKWSAMNFRDDA
jgi:hypothetical protein